MLALLILVPLAILVLVNAPLNFMRKLAWPLAVALAAVQSLAIVLCPVAFWAAATHIENFFVFRLLMDPLSRVLLLSIGIVVFVALLLGRSMITGERKSANFVSVILIALAGMNGVVLLQDLFSLYVFLEVASVASFVLIAFNRERNGLEGAFKYIILSAVATILMIGAIAILLLVADGTSFDAIRAALAVSGGNGLVKLAVGAFICGLFIKGGLVPFHGWLPGAYQGAPAPVSVLLAGIVTKVSGIYALIRLVTTVFPLSGAVNEILLLVGALSIVVGALGALWQDDMKRLLAYSSISQVGYIILGLGCGTPLGFAGAVLHLFNHSIFKSLLFVDAAAVEQRLGTTDMRRLGGLGSRMPVTSATSVIGLLSAAGVPPLSGFWSKLLIIVALWQGAHYTLAFVAVGLSVVTLGYLLLMCRKVFFGKPPAEFAEVREAQPGIVISALILSAITVGIGVLFPLIVNTFLLTFLLPVERLF